MRGARSVSAAAARMRGRNSSASDYRGKPYLNGIVAAAAQTAKRCAS